jgi:hypothetical protein
MYSSLVQIVFPYDFITITSQMILRIVKYYILSYNTLTAVLIELNI